MLADRVQGRAEEIGVGDAADRDGVLERDEHAFARAFLRLHREQVPTLEQYGSLDHGVGGVPAEHLGERTLPRAVRAHDGVHFPGAHRQIDAAQDLVAFDRRVEVLYLEHCVSGHRTLSPGLRPAPGLRPGLGGYPTLPSRLMPSSRCASTANSMGSSLKTSLQKPFTIMPT